MGLNCIFASSVSPPHWMIADPPICKLPCYLLCFYLINHHRTLQSLLIVTAGRERERAKESEGCMAAERRRRATGGHAAFGAATN